MMPAFLPMNANELSKTLAAKFLENGNYEALGVGLGHKSVANFATPAAFGQVDEYFEPAEGFSGLAVQSVGYTAGAEKEEVIIYVTKGSRKALKELPREVEGIPVRADVMGRLKAGPVPAMAAGRNGNFYEKLNRIACGSSCAPSGEDYAGTLGALATDGARTFALSNNHVFAACNHTPVGMPILAPATMDSGPRRRAPSEICRHDSIVELRSGVPALVAPMRVDAAIAAVSDPDQLSSWQGDDADGYDTPSQVVQPVSGMKVKKFGRTTGFTLGTVEALVVTPWVLPYKGKRFSAEVWFQDTWTVRSDDADPFALGGDSGSLIVTEDGTAAVGLLFAANRTGDRAIMAPIQAVLAAFGNLRLVTGHGH